VPTQWLARLQVRSPFAARIQGIVNSSPKALEAQKQIPTLISKNIECNDKIRLHNSLCSGRDQGG